MSHIKHMKHAYAKPDQDTPEAEPVITTVPLPKLAWALGAAAGGAAALAGAALLSLRSSAAKPAPKRTTATRKPRATGPRKKAK